MRKEEKVDSSIHLAITRTVREGMEKEYEAALRRFFKDAFELDSTEGAHLIRPAPGSSSREYGIIRSFPTKEAEQAFYQSQLYLDWEQEVAKYVVGESRTRPLHGLEAFFRESTLAPPPKWKMAIITWLAVYPAVLLWSKLIPPLLGTVHHFIKSGIVSAFVVVTLAWLLMPLLTKLFAPWLHSESKGSEK